MRIIRKTDIRTFSNPLFCKECGTKLPVEITEGDNKTHISVWCKHCKTVTDFRIVD